MYLKFKAVNAIILFIFLGSNSCSAQPTRNVGGGCEGCEALFEFGTKVLTPTDTLPGYHDNEPKLKITGTVFELDGITPAEGVIVYIYHTDRNGVYPKLGDETGWGRRHGYIRGWIKTGEDGSYTFYTFRPASYPNSSEPAHIHITVKEPDTNAYYLDDYVFDDDPSLTRSHRDNFRNRGGSGIMIPTEVDGIMTITRDIILGLNVTDYR